MTSKGGGPLIFAAVSLIFIDLVARLHKYVSPLALFANGAETAVG